MSLVCLMMASLCLVREVEISFIAEVVLVWLDSRALSREVASFKAAVMAVLCAMDCAIRGGRFDACAGVTCSPEWVRLWEAGWVGGT